ncbi:tetratricopeptide repeat protein [Bythopirellula polymerisocia]|uniref:tetratricopeptide repeat protein n=1 Tax=Bythopirellula polymerisocia TaxID=2528003 RepID=UPI0018D365D1|nr:tetratricopeptide repeat protein [Bythopirellula polymerisocia]
MNRNASWYREDARAAMDEGETEEAFNKLLNYVRLRPDEEEPLIELANIGLTIIEEQEASSETISGAFATLNETVARTGDPDLRLKLTKLIIGHRPQDALNHLNELLQLPEKSGDSELESMYAQALYKVKGSKPALDYCLRLVGYDKASDSFDSAKATAKERPEVYSLLAALIIDRDQDKEFAQRVMDQMIAENPESADAFLKQSIFLRSLGEVDESLVALEKAYELEPDSVAVARQKGAVAFEDKEYETAEKIFAAALEKHPDDLILYDLLSRTLVQENKLDEAMAILNQGAAKLGEKQALGFSQLKLNILFQQSDYEGIDKEILELERARNPKLTPFIDFTKARVDWQKQKWTSAAKKLKNVWPRLIDFPQEQAMAGALLASSYERQNKLDLALQVYTEVADKFPQYEAAQKGKVSVQNRIKPQSTSETMDFDRAVNEMAAKPAELQDWSQIDAMLEKLGEEHNLTEAGINLLQSQVLMKRGNYDEAKELIRQAALLAPDDVRVRYAAISLLLEDPDSGPSKAMSLLDKLEEKFGDSPQVRSTRASILRALNEPNVDEQLDELAIGADQWSIAEHAQIEASIALQFEALKKFDKAIEHWNRAIEITPDSLPMRLHMFELAFQQRDIPGMLAAEDLILDLVNDKNDGNYVLTQVRRQLVEYALGEATREDLVASRKRMEQALTRRAEWHELHILYAQLLLTLQEDLDLALQHLNDALKYGPPNMSAVSLQAKLLRQRGNFAEARKKMELINPESRMQLLGRVEAEILLQTGESEAAFEAAQKLAEAEPNNASTQVWFANIAQQSANALEDAALESNRNEVAQKVKSRLDDAARALTKATELTPSDADVWMQLISIYAQQKNNNKIEEKLREAQLAIDVDLLPLLIAKKLELMGDWAAAEKIYLANFSSRMDELPILQRLAEFYFLWSKQGKVPAQRGFPFVNQILRLANEGKVEPDNTYVVWARDRAARILAGSGEYQKSLLARKLLNPTGDLDELSPSDKVLFAEILTTRAEPEAQLKAMELLSDMDRQGTISKQGVVALARLLGKAGDWERGRQLMLNTLKKYGDDEQVSATFVDLLIDNDEFAMASNRLDKLKDINSKNSSIMPLSIKLAAKSGDETKLQRLLQNMLPKSLSGALSSEELNNIVTVARMAAENDQIELAAKLYPVYVQRVGTAQAALEYASFLTKHGDPGQAMEIIKQIFPKQMDAAAQIAVSMLRQRRSEVGDQFDAEIDDMLAAALRDDPDSASRLLLKAEALEVQGKQDESIAFYEKILKRDDLPSLLRAAAKNNLGFLLASTDQRLDEAQEMINQAMEVYGPSEDILDTRAVVRIAGKNYDGAVEDMELATSLSRDPLKFYHSALANLLAGNDQVALKSWDRAKKLGITKDKLPLSEQPDFERIKGQIEGLRTQNAKL